VYANKPAKCPTCSEDGECFTGTVRAEQLHFSRRLLWDAHRLRQALQADKREFLEAMVSKLIHRIDRVVSILLDRDD
jgi:hypothetical protein